jgi:hypothetical protein
MIKANKNQTHTFDAALLRPRPVLTLGPELHIAFKAHACKYAAFARSADMVAAKSMSLFKDLHLGERILFSGVLWVEVASRGRRMDSDRRRTRRGDELCGSGREREYVRGMGLGDRVHLKVLFRHGCGSFSALTSFFLFGNVLMSGVWIQSCGDVWNMRTFEAAGRSPWTFEFIFHVELAVSHEYLF